MLGIYLTGPSEELLKECSERMGHLLRQLLVEGLVVVGPAAAAPARKNDVYRRVIYLKHSCEAAILKAEKELQRELEQDTIWQKIYIQFDHNPLNAF